MIKIEICECIDPLNPLFEKNEKYLVRNIKNSPDKCAYATLHQGFPVYRSYTLFFKPVLTLYFKNDKELKEFVKRVFTIIKTFGKHNYRRSVLHGDIDFIVTQYNLLKGVNKNMSICNTGYCKSVADDNVGMFAADEQCPACKAIEIKAKQWFGDGEVDVNLMISSGAITKDQIIKMYRVQVLKEPE